jgi:hypothetical protein
MPLRRNRRLLTKKTINKLATDQGLSNVLKSYVNAFFSENARPGREQNLLIGLSKHLYFLKDGTLKYQEKAIDPRVSGNKTLLLRFVLLDVDTGAIYGECHTQDEADLAGFLARAWSVKPRHPMRGIPELLNIPKIVSSTPEYSSDIELFQRLTGLNIGALPSGFAAGVHAVKAFEKEVESLSWSFRLKTVPNLHVVQACSGVMSALCCASMPEIWRQRWGSIPAPTKEFFAAVDALYEQPGGWRFGAFRSVLED